MKAANGLNVPTGWGQREAADRQPCPVCHRATDVVTNTAGYKALASHTWLRALRRSSTPETCPGTGRLVA